MYTVKLIRNEEENSDNIGYSYTCIQCNHYEVTHFKNGDACVAVYPDLLQTNGVEYKLGRGCTFSKAFIENEKGATIDKVISETAEKQAQDTRQRLEAALMTERRE